MRVERWFVSEELTQHQLQGPFSAKGPEFKAAPASYGLGHNYPNPFNPTTVVHYQLPEDAFVSLKVYDLVGREVASLIHEAKEAGYHEVMFDASRLGSGVYFYRMSAVPSAPRDLVLNDRQAGSFVAVRKLMVLK